MVEYILMLVVVVSIVLGMKKGFQNLNNSMDNYVGSYIKCLMEYGELPTLGIDVADLKKHSATGGVGKTCDAKFAGFTFTGGRPPTGGGTPGSAPGGTTNPNSSGSGSGANNQNGKNDANSSSGANNSSNEQSGGSGSDGSGSGRNKNNRNNSSYAGGQIKRSASSYGASDAGSDGAAGKGKVKVLEEDETDSKGNRNGSRRRGNRPTQFVYTKDPKYKAITGEYAENNLKRLPRKSRVPTSSIVSIAKNEEGMRFGPYVKTLNLPERKEIIKKESDDAGFGFGNLMKWLVIAGIIVAIVVFFGGQIMNYSNSQD